jgi:four helix bundle protein
MASESSHAGRQLLFIRNGCTGRKDFYIPDVKGMAEEEVLADVLHQFYAKDMIVPAEVLLPLEMPDRTVFEAWRIEKRGAAVDVQVPQRGRKRELVQMASDNAVQSLKEHLLSRKSKERILLRLQEELGLRNLPRRIEAFDISNIQGTETVASLVSFENNLPDKRNYKRYKIRTVAGPDDFASMAEVVRRRYTKAKEEGMLPDLILIDGGKGQLNAALDVLLDLGIDGPDVLGLAKARSGEEGSIREFERVFLPGMEEPVVLDPTSSVTHLVARVRDEAHRFAITYHRKLREKRAIRSELDDIPGIGETRKKALLGISATGRSDRRPLGACSREGMSKKAGSDRLLSGYRVRSTGGREGGSYQKELLAVNKITGFRELKVWQRAYELTLDLYRITRKFPKAEIYGLTSQLQRAAVSVPANIAEGYERNHRKEYLQFIFIAKGSLGELETLLLLARDLLAPSRF